MAETRNLAGHLNGDRILRSFVTHWRMHFFGWMTVLCCWPNTVKAQTVWPSSSDRDTDAARKAHEELLKPTQMDFVEMPLDQVLEFLSDYHGIKIQTDSVSLHRAKVSPSKAIVTRSRRGGSLNSALHLTLQEHDLTHYVGDKGVLITTPEAAEKAREQRVYDVADLLDQNSTAKSLAQTLTHVLSPDVQLDVTATDKLPQKATDNPNVLRITPKGTYLEVEASPVMQQRVGELLAAISLSSK